VTVTELLHTEKQLGFCLFFSENTNQIALTVTTTNRTHANSNT